MRGNSCRAAATALATNATIVTLTPAASACIASDFRNASRSVTSARSCCVTCGTPTQLAWRFAAEIFRMRGSSTSSMGPNFAKSTRRTAPTPGIPPPLVSERLTYFSTSSLRIRPSRADPSTRVRSTPSSRAKRRTDGLASGGASEPAAACGRGSGDRPGAAPGGFLAAGSSAGFATSGFFGAFASDGDFGGGGTPPSRSSTSRSTTARPAETLSPTFT